MESEQAPSPQPAEATQFAVLLFTDICDSTALKVKHGAPAYRAAAERHNQLFERLAAEEKLTVINYTGDGYFARTPSVVAAVRFALRFQHGMRAMAWPDFALTTRVGIHAGEAAEITVRGHTEVLAPAADLAARVMGLAVGGQILLTRGSFDEARHFVRSHPAEGTGEPLALTWLAHGPYLFKGCEDPVEIFEVGAADFAPLAVPPDGEKAKRAVRPGEEEALGWRPACGLEVPGRAGWVLAQKLGEGGFGEVWLAEQPKLKQRRVFKFCFDEERLRSFKRELTFFRLLRDALGEREDIARLYDVKLDAPPFFLESEFAPHGNLVAWCEDRGGVAEVPLRRRLEIIARVADAVAAAHSIGILHKDLKPQNVLMQSRPGGGEEPQLTDFGIGALADKTALAAHEITAAGFTVMTVPGSKSSGMTRLYAPPEQLVGKPYTVQGDVYALGVMLYQFVIADFARALAPGWERDVEDALLREDIAACVDGEPARRLPSAAELARRLRSLDERRAELGREREQARLAEELVASEARAKADRERWQHTRRIAAMVGVLALVAIGAGVVAVRQAHTARVAEQAAKEQAARASAAEALARARLGHAAQARDAAENLVSQAIFGLLEKLVPLGKIGVLEDMTAAAEEYYAKLPADLVSDETRHHEVRLALNRAMIFGARSDDDAMEASLTKSLALARELEAKHPEDSRLRQAQYLALMGFALLRNEQSRHEDLAGNARELKGLAESWLAKDPTSIPALRAKLVAYCMSFLAMEAKGDSPLAALPVFLEARAVSQQLKLLGGETMETRVFDASTKLAKARLASKTANADTALKLFGEANDAFRIALETGGEHALVRQFMLTARAMSIGHLRKLAQDTNDETLAREAHRQQRELVAERAKLAESEPARLEWWRNLAWAYTDGTGAVARFEGSDAWLVWAEKGVAAADRAASPRGQRENVRQVRISARMGLMQALAASRPPGWEERALRLPKEAIEIMLAPSTSGKVEPDINLTWEPLNRWREAAIGLAGQPARHEEMVTQLREMAAAAQRVIDAVPSSSKPRRDAIDQVGKAADFLRDRSRPEAAELGKMRDRWQLELEEKFADDPSSIFERARRAQSRGWNLLNAMRKAPDAEKEARFAELETHVKQALAVLEKNQARMSEHDFAYHRGAYLAALGSALLDWGKFAAAEPLLREAMAARKEAEAKAKNPPDAVSRRWDAADSQGRLGVAVFKQGREDEGRKLRREAAETFESIARQQPTWGRWRDAGLAWRRYGEMLDQPGQEEVRMEPRQKAVELARESVRMATASGATPGELASCRAEAGWAMRELGYAQRGAKHPTEAEAALREAVAVVEENVASAKPGTEPGWTRQLALTRWDLALLFIESARPEEARQQIGKTEVELRAFEKSSGRTETEFAEAWQHLEELRRRLPN